MFENFGGLILPLTFIGLMYFMIYLPQKKREKKNQEMIQKLENGNEIVTIGGIMGKILNIKDNEITIESGIEGTKLKISKWSIKQIIENEQ